MSRKDTLRALLTARERRLPTGNFEPSELDDQPADSAPKPLVRSGAVGAMGRSLGKITSAAEEAKALLGSASAVIELDPGLIEGSFLVDRLIGSDADHQALVASIKSTASRCRSLSGHIQQSPVAIRWPMVTAG